MTCNWQDFQNSQHGSTSIIFALASVAIFGLAAFAVDNGSWRQRQSDMQSMADTAALAGARQLAVLASSNEVETAAKAFLAAKLKPGAATNVTIDEALGSVMIEVSEPGRVYFSSIIGFGQPEIRVVSEAITSTGSRPCIIALDPSAPVGIDMSLAGSVTAYDCAIWSNATSATSFDINGSGTAASSQNCAVGGVTGTGFAITPAVQTNCEAAKDPLLDWSPPAYSICDNTLPDRLNSGAVTLSPGVYCGGLRLSGSTQVTLMPGIYVMKDGPLYVTSNASITGDGVTILLTGTGASVDFLGSSRAHLSAATSGPTEGLVIAAGRGEPVVTSRVGGGAEMDIEGTVYLPTHELSYGGQSESLMPSSYSLIIAKSIKFHGGSNVVVRGDPSLAKVPAKTAIIQGKIRLNR